MFESMRAMPTGVRLVLGFGFVLLAGVGLTLPLVVNQAIEAAITPIGLLWMLLLAYLVFTLTLILQRKQAAWMLSLGLATLSVPLSIALWAWAGFLGALLGAVISVLLFWSLRGAPVRAWFSEP
ncbi:MAG: hypothetical protein ABI797_06695 [Chloroflexota bacterium]